MVDCSFHIVLLMFWSSTCYSMEMSMANKHCNPAHKIIINFCWFFISVPDSGLSLRFWLFIWTVMRLFFCSVFNLYSWCSFPFYCCGVAFINCYSPFSTFISSSFLTDFPSFFPFLFFFLPLPLSFLMFLVFSSCCFLMFNFFS